MMPKLPEPNFKLIWRGGQYWVSKPNIASTDVYTPETVRAIQEEAYKAGMAAAQTPPPWWPAVENILKEYGLNAMDFAADFKNAKDAADRIEALEAALRQAREALADSNQKVYELCSTFSVPKPEATHGRNAAVLSAINVLLNDTPEKQK